MKRSGKFYRKNEAEVMRSLGLTPTPNSGSGAIWKEDGQNDCVICQLKSTDAESIRIQRKDLHTLEYNASVCHKTPVFAVQFIQGNEVWLMVKPEDLGALQGITGVCGETVVINPLYKSMFNMAKENIEAMENLEQSAERMKEKSVVSSAKARERFRQEVEARYEKKGKSAT